MKADNINIRPIEPGDNAQLAKVVRNTLAEFAEFGANHPGTVYYDPTTDSFLIEQSHCM
jgi:putative acetyltransferase